MLIGISLKSVPQGPINNNSSLVKVMACCLIGDQPSLESVTQSTDINVSRSQRDILRIFSQRIWGNKHGTPAWNYAYQIRSAKDQQYECQLLYRLFQPCLDNVTSYFTPAFCMWFITQSNHFRYVGEKSVTILDQNYMCLVLCFENIQKTDELFSDYGHFRKNKGPI